MMNRFSFPVILTPDPMDEGFVVSFPDVPEAITQGESIADALVEAVDCLEEAIAARIDEEMDIPLPSESSPSQHRITLPLQMSLKAILYLSVQETHTSKSELARQLNLDEKEIRRIFDPRHPTKVPTMEKLLSRLGKRLFITVSSV
jgi:antitoxin HicB